MLTGHSIPVCWAYLTRKTEDLYREGVFRCGYSRNLPFGTEYYIQQEQDQG